MKKNFIHGLLMAFFLYFVFITTLYAEEPNYDLVILHVNVYDPGSGKSFKDFNVGIKNGKIMTLTRSPIVGSREIQGEGKLLTPGFIDTFQRHYGEIFDGIRLKDGVTSSIYAMNATSEKALLDEGNTISHIHRVLLFDLSPVFATYEGNTSRVYDFSEADASFLKDQLNQSFSGLYLDVKQLMLLPKFDFIDDSIPLYINLSHQKDSHVLPFIEEVRKHNPNRPIHLVEANRFTSIMGSLLSYAKEDPLFTLGGYPFGYVNTDPQLEVAERISSWIHKPIYNQKEKEMLELDGNFRQKNGTWAVLDLLSESLRQEILGTPSFTGESYGSYPGPVMSTQDANTFLGKVFLSEKDESSLYKVIDSHTIVPTQIFPSATSPFLAKGRIQIGMDADLLIFDPEQIPQFSFINEDIHPSSGLDYVIREGVVVYEQNELVPNYPKARYLSVGSLPYERIKHVEVKCEGLSKKEMTFLKYQDRVYLPLCSLIDYLELLYEEDGPKIYVGGLLQLEIGQHFFSMGSNKTNLEHDILLMNDQVHMELEDFKRLFTDFFVIGSEDDELLIERGEKYSLLNKVGNESQDVRFEKKWYTIPLLYSIALILVLMFFINLNRPRLRHKNLTPKKKKRER
ncbi:MAG: hypothetical protein Q4Q17_03780 [Tissierellia bacterium]|nr:hypothetical protein [Tissierellia bacterium]